MKRLLETISSQSEVSVEILNETKSNINQAKINKFISDAKRIANKKNIFLCIFEIK
jgi:hypothetical protein